MFDRLSIKATALLGFGVMLAIWVIAGYDFSQRINDTRNRAAAITERYTDAQGVFATVRAQVLLGSVYVRDALLDPNPVTAEYRRQVEDAYLTLNQAVHNYVPVLDSPTERDSLDRLQRAIDNFRETMLRVLATDSDAWPNAARELLRTQVVPQREVVIRVSEEMQALNREAFVRQQMEIADVYASSQRRFLGTLTLALLASFGIALLAVASVGRLEKRFQKQLVRDEQTTRELQDLSARMITVQEEERRRIARELHDEVGQGLMAIRVELAVAQNAIEAAGLDARVLEDVRSNTEGALAKIRDLSHVLHPSMLDDLGLVTAVQAYAREFNRRYGIRVDVLPVNMEERLARDIDASIYRIVQEALTNVAKHARATACLIRLQRLGQTLLAEIEDNGKGFDRTATATGPEGGLGLISIRERATQLRGSVRIESAPDRGTRLSIELPVRLRTEVDHD